MTVAAQVRRLIDVGVADLANLNPSAFAEHAVRLQYRMSWSASGECE